MDELCLAAVMPSSLHPLSHQNVEIVGPEVTTAQNNTLLYSGPLKGRGLGMGNVSLKHSIFLGKGRGDLPGQVVDKAKSSETLGLSLPWNTYFLSVVL